MYIVGRDQQCRYQLPGNCIGRRAELIKAESWSFLRTTLTPKNSNWDDIVTCLTPGNHHNDVRSPIKWMDYRYPGIRYLVPAPVLVESVKKLQEMLHMHDESLLWTSTGIVQQHAFRSTPDSDRHDYYLVPGTIPWYHHAPWYWYLVPTIEASMAAHQKLKLNKKCTASIDMVAYTAI